MGDFALDAWEGKPLSLCCPVNPPHALYLLNLNERGWNATTDRGCFAAHSWHNRHTRRRCFRWSDRRMPECTISPEFIDGLLREGDPTMIPPTEKALMQTAIGEGHRYLHTGAYFLFYKKLGHKYTKEIF